MHKQATHASGGGLPVGTRTWSTPPKVIALRTMRLSSPVQQEKHKSRDQGTVLIKYKEVTPLLGSA